MSNENNFSDDFYHRWQHLLKDIEVEEIPTKFVKDVTVSLKDSEPQRFNLLEMFEKKMSVKKIESVIQKFLNENESRVLGVDFNLNLHAISEAVTKKVSKILGND